MESVLKTDFRVWLSLCLTFATGVAIAGEDVVGERVRLAARHLSDGQYAAAEKNLVAALAETDSSGLDDPRRATVLNNLGFVYQLMGKYSQAESCFRRAIDIWRRSPGTTDLELARCIGNLAKLYVENRQFAKAERLDLRSLAERVQRLHPPNADLARLLVSLGVLERSRSNFAAAESYQAEALEIWERLSPDGTEVVQTLNNLALVYMDAGRHKDALSCFERALSRVETGRMPEDGNVATLFANLGNFQFRVRGPGQAEPYFQRALAIAEKSLGQEHQLTGQILADYAVVLRKIKKKGQAKQLEKRAKAIADLTAAGVPGIHTIDVSDLVQKPASH